MNLTCIIAFKAPFDDRLACNISKLQRADVQIMIGCADIESFKVLEENNLSEFVCNIGDAGIYDSWNKLINMCASDYLLFFGKDDEINFEKFKTYLSFVETNLKNKDAIFPVKNFKYLQSAEMMIKNSHLIIHPGAVYSRKLFQTVSFDIAYPINADLKLNCDLIIQSIPQYYLYNDFANIGSGGVSQSAYKSVLDCWRIRRRYIGTILATQQLVLDSLAYLKRKLIAFN